MMKGKINMNSTNKINKNNRHWWAELLLKPLLFSDILDVQELLLDETLEAGEVAERAKIMKRLSTGQTVLNLMSG